MSSKFLVRFGGVSGEFGRAMIRILTRRRRAKITMQGVTERAWYTTEANQKGTIWYLLYPSQHDIVAISGQWLDVSGCQDSRHSFWLASWEFSTVI